jgi:hypothetical protein
MLLLKRIEARVVSNLEQRACSHFLLFVLEKITLSALRTGFGFVLLAAGEHVVARDALEAQQFSFLPSCLRVLFLDDP